ncbi:MAG: hypothetical protein KKB50_10145 [Planctomycetes bacterium]|nr:hypothetical protein [Planctomycetota bacterium]
MSPRAGGRGRQSDGAWRGRAERGRFDARGYQDGGSASRGRNAAVGTLGAAEEDALRAALLDEYGADAYYSSVIEKFGSSRKLENIRRAEQRHAGALLSLFERYGLEPPERSAVGTPAVPKTPQGAIQLAAEVEAGNVAMYDELIDAVDHEDIRRVLERLRDASLNHHLPALQRGW